MNQGSDVSGSKGKLIAELQLAYSHLKRLDKSMTEVTAAIQKAAAQDHQIIVTLRNKYQIPHLLAVAANAYADLADSLAAMAKTLDQ